MLRFRRMRTLQKFASVHASVHNHVSTERHLQNRNAYTQTLTSRSRRVALPPRSLTERQGWVTETACIRLTAPDPVVGRRGRKWPSCAVAVTPSVGFARPARSCT